MEIVYGADWGILPGNDETLTARMAAMLSALADRHDICLRMEPGEYHFYPKGVDTHSWHISNHDYCGAQAVGVLLKGLRHFTLDGGGSRWILHSEILPCCVMDCEDVCLKHFSVDHARPVYSQGIIRQAGPQQMTVWIDSEAYPWYLKDGKLYFQGENFPNAVHLCLEMDAKTNAPAWGTEDLYFCTETQKVGLHPTFRAVGADLLQITLTGQEQFFPGSRAGNRLIFRHHPRSAPAVYVTDSAEIRCEDIRIFHAAGMGFLAERCENVTLERFVVAPDPDSGRCFSAAADATHFVNCGGLLRLEHCRFENQLDDGLNVHGFYGVVSQQPQPHILRLDWGHPMQRGVRLARPGDLLGLMPADRLRPFWKGRIRRVLGDADWEMLLEMETPPPLLTGGRWVAENLTLTPQIHVKDCVLRGNRARGMLLTCRRALVEDCELQVPGAGIYLEGEAEYWYESGATEEIVLRGNRFVNCSYIPQWGCAPIVVCPKVRLDEGWYFHRRILLERNRFFCFDRRLLWGRGIGALCLTENQCTMTQAYPPQAGERLELQDCGWLGEDTQEQNNILAGKDGIT